jgi:hypothetical protein
MTFYGSFSEEEPNADNHDVFYSGNLATIKIKEPNYKINSFGDLKYFHFSIESNYSKVELTCNFGKINFALL